MSFELIKIILFLAILSTISQAVLKYSSMYNNNYYVFSLLSYIVITMTLYKLYKTANISDVVVWWSIVSIILSIIIGCVYFNEKMTTCKNTCTLTLR